MALLVVAVPENALAILVGLLLARGLPILFLALLPGLARRGRLAGTIALLPLTLLPLLLTHRNGAALLARLTGPVLALARLLGLAATS